MGQGRRQAGRALGSGTIGKSGHQRRSNSALGGQGEMGGGVAQSTDVEKFLVGVMSKIRLG